MSTVFIVSRVGFLTSDLFTCGAQVKSGTIFDNILVTDDIEYAAKFRDETWGSMKDAEKAMFDRIEEEKKAEQAAARATEDEEKAGLEDDYDEAEDNDDAEEVDDYADEEEGAHDEL